VNREPLLAEELLLERGRYLDPEEVYQLTLLSSGSEEEADTARARRIEEIMAEREAQGSGAEDG
jgi:hypothetical protein